MSFLQSIYELLMLVMFYRQLHSSMTEKKYCAIIFSVSFVCSLIRAANNSQSLDNVQLTKPLLLPDMMTRQIKYQRLSPCTWRFAHRVQQSYLWPWLPLNFTVDRVICDSFNVDPKLLVMETKVRVCCHAEHSRKSSHLQTKKLNVLLVRSKHFEEN